MAKQADYEKLERLYRQSRTRHIHQILLKQLDDGRLCPTCQLPIQEQGGDPVLYCGEMICPACVKAFRNGQETR